MASTSEMEEVSAAKSTSTKNTVPMMRPPGMPPNICGSTTNISEGPEEFMADSAAAPPPVAEKMAGMTMSEAKTANSESHTAICTPAGWILALFFMYEP